MTIEKEPILLVLNKHPEGLTVRDLHALVAAYEIQRARDGRIKDLGPEYEFMLYNGRSGVYSHDVAIALSELLRDGKIRMVGGGKLILSKEGRTAITPELAAKTDGPEDVELTSVSMNRIRRNILLIDLPKYLSARRVRRSGELVTR